MKQRLDQLLFSRGLVPSRSQAESWIRLGKVTVNGKAVTKPGAFTDPEADIQLKVEEQYVSRAGLKLASVAKILHLQFEGKVMLDVGSSTGGFTDYALKHGIRKVYAVDVGTNQLHPSLRGDARIELYEQTDIRAVTFRHSASRGHTQTSGVAGTARAPLGSLHAGKPVILGEVPDLVVIDVSFISLRDILPHIASLCGPQTTVAAMVKPQFEARESGVMHKGVIKNDKMRREILKDFESWVTKYFMILDKADSDVAGSKGNRERFYKLRPPKNGTQ
jgi:23S rRNA (cytidine1920-2'-O)/16S rRNA (cytidine1409-2'-O)-methyltransferase